MKKKSENILGFIELETGAKAITPLNDVFLNYTFGQETYWETLRNMTNIFYNAYIETHKETTITPIEGKIVVKTQFPHFRDFNASIPKKQDMEIDSADKIDYIEFQNDMHPKIPIEVQSVEYYAFSLTRGKDKRATGLWLLNGTVTNLLQGKIYSNYILMDEVDYRPHPSPNNSSILYVDLKQLASCTNTQAGELAGVLTGKVKEPKDPEVRLILQNLKHSFNVFKDDTEVRNIMTRAELFEARGEAKAQAELLPLLTEKDEQISELMTRAELLEARGEAKGEAKAQAELLPLLNEKDEQISELVTRAELLEARGEAKVQAELLPLLNEKDEQISELMTRVELLEARGKAKGEAKVQAELLPLLNEKDGKISEQAKRIEELEAMLAKNKA